MCYGPSLPEPEHPPRSDWEIRYAANSCLPCLWGIETAGCCIGIAGFHHISQEDHSTTYRLDIFNVAFHSHGLGTETTFLLLQYGFETMGWHRFDLKVLEYNHRAIRCYERCGFKREGILRESAFINGQYYADIIMSILANEYRSLSRTEPRKSQKLPSASKENQAGLYRPIQKEF